ncbi:MAG: hypothetical protein Aurels2KO_52810 [Aureliella sp.]
MYKVTQEFVDQLRSEGFDVWTISLWENWLKRYGDFCEIKRSIRTAFFDVKLGSGMGMLEADGRDRYADDAELAALRSRDERDNWKSFSSETLNQYYCSFGYLDAKGMLFHLPAYLLCELNDEYDFQFMDFLIGKFATRVDWQSWLDTRQSACLWLMFGALKEHPDFYDQHQEIESAMALLRYQAPDKP